MIERSQNILKNKVETLFDKGRVHGTFNLYEDYSRVTEKFKQFLQPLVRNLKKTK